VIDLSGAVVVSPRGRSDREAVAVAVLEDEIRKRSGLSLSQGHALPAGTRASLVVGTESSLADLVRPWLDRLDALPRPGAEGWRLLAVGGERPVVLVVGADARGMLYGVGGLLRRLRLRQRAAALVEEVCLSTTPRSALRGHQLGYRPLNNTYDAWTVGQYEQYIRELALFGANTIEFVPPGADDIAPTAPHMPVDPYEMLVACSRICDAYGLDVSLWYPNEGEDYRDPDCVAEELAEREGIFSRMPRLDALFIPGGDPGDLDPDTLFTWSERVAALLRKHHPRAKVCLSSQSFRITDEWLAGFYARVREEPDWLDSIAFAPWERDSLPVLRERIPLRYPIRRYPDITHCHLCQYPVPKWDLAFAMTESREPINPRPVAQKHIHNLFREYAVGSVTYSEGVNDDVNKFVWADQEWDPTGPVETTLKDYARFFIDPDCADEAARGLLALERNWEGPLAQNEGVEETLALWQAIERRASGRLPGNWRFEMGLLRAYYDAYLRRRLLSETALERRAMAALRSAPRTNLRSAVDEAERILQHTPAQPVARDLKERCDDLADRLWEHIGLQLTTTRHHGQRTIRGAFMDSIDLPLNDRDALLEQFAHIRTVEDEAEAARAVSAIVNRTDPGPGGFYDDFGSPASWRRVQPGRGWHDDPAFHFTPLVEYHLSAKPLAWRSAVTTRVGTPLTVVYEGLDPGSSYVLRVTYQPSPWPYSVRLTANATHLVHDCLAMKKHCWTEEFDIPADVLAGGTLQLTWTTRNGELGARVAELWLIRQ